MSQRARRLTPGNPRGAEGRWVWLIARVICGPCAMKNAHTYSEGGRPVGIGIWTDAEDVLRIRKQSLDSPIAARHKGMRTHLALLTTFRFQDLKLKSRIGVLSGPCIDAHVPTTRREDDGSEAAAMSLRSAASEHMSPRTDALAGGEKEMTTPRALPPTSSENALPSRPNTASSSALACRCGISSSESQRGGGVPTRSWECPRRTRRRTPGTRRRVRRKLLTLACSLQPRAAAELLKATNRRASKYPLRSLRCEKVRGILTLQA